MVDAADEDDAGVWALRASEIAVRCGVSSPAAIWSSDRRSGSADATGDGGAHARGACTWVSAWGPGRRRECLLTPGLSDAVETDPGRSGRRGSSPARAISSVTVVDAFAGFADEVRDALAGVPESERALLELRLSWPVLGEREALIAARLRVFLLTWDPFWWMRHRGTSWATSTGDGDSYEVVVYLTLHDALRRAREKGGTLADVIGGLAGSVLAVGGRHAELLVSGAYPQLVFAGEVPGLLSEAGSRHGLPSPRIELAASGWDPIGLGAIQDLAQERYGPVDLDRSQVRLEPAAEPAPDCPACAGGRFGFPAELDERRAAMCPEHAEQAQRIITERLERAPRSNREGWDAIVGGSSMLEEPTFGLALWLLAELGKAADRDRRAPPTEKELRADAELALELAARLPASLRCSPS
jgi:hypothetical protein